MDSTSINELLGQSDWLGRLALAIVKNAADADDMVQDVWLAALKNPPQKGNERSWFRGVLRRRAINAGRAARRNLPLEVEVEEGNASDPLGSVVTLESHARLGEALQRLPEAYRDVVVARYLQGKEPAAIAAMLGEPASTVRSRISRGLSLLREELERETAGGRQAVVLALLPLALQAQGTTAKTLLGASSFFKSLGFVMSQKITAAGIVLIVGSLAWFAYDYGRTPDVEFEVAEHEAVRDETRREAVRNLPAANGAAAAADEKPIGNGDKESATLPARWSIVDHANQRIGGARIVVYGEQQVIADLQSDEQGHFRVAPGIARSRYVAMAPGYALKFGDFQNSEGRRIKLDRGAELAGRVHVKGGLPYRKLALLVKQESPELEALPMNVRNAIWPIISDHGCARLQVSADGSFSLLGLEADQRVTVGLSRGFKFETGTRYFGTWKTFEHPRADVILNVCAMPRFIGRLVRAESGEPVPYHPLTAQIGRNKSTSSTVAGYTETDGRFILGFDCTEYYDVRLFIPRGSTNVEIFHSPAFADTIDVGDVILPDIPSWNFKVVNLEGNAVKAPVLATKDGRLAPTMNEDGSGRIEALSENIREVWVGAAGYKTQTIEVLRGSDGPQVIELVRGNQLTIRLGEVPAPLEVHDVCVSGPVGLKPENFHFDITSNVVERSSFGVSQQKDRIEISFTASEDGVFSVQDLAPGIVMTVSARDEHEQVIMSVSGIMLGAAEHKTIDLRFNAAGTDVAQLTLVDEKGAPISPAKLKVPGKGMDEIVVWADKKGRINFINSTGQRRTDITISAKGYRKRTLTQDDLAAGSRKVVLMSE